MQKKKTIIMSNQMTQKYSEFITNVLQDFGNKDLTGIIMIGISKDPTNHSKRVDTYSWQTTGKDFEDAEFALREVTISSKANALAMTILEDAYAEDLASDEIGYDDSEDEFNFDCDDTAEEDCDCDEE